MSVADYGLAAACGPEQPEVHVIFVHGLGGHRSRTWTNKNDQFWPGWLENSVPTARVWTYGYNAGFLQDPSADSLDLHCAKFLDACIDKVAAPSSSQIVFVCHSLGGILVKQASHVHPCTCPCTFLSSDL